jgi:hypothetical protein
LCLFKSNSQFEGVSYKISNGETREVFRHPQRSRGPEADQSPLLSEARRLFAGPSLKGSRFRPARRKAKDIQSETVRSTGFSALLEQRDTEGGERRFAYCRRGQSGIKETVRSTGLLTLQERQRQRRPPAGAGPGMRKAASDNSVTPEITSSR